MKRDVTTLSNQASQIEQRYQHQDQKTVEMIQKINLLLTQTTMKVEVNS